MLKYIKIIIYNIDRYVDMCYYKNMKAEERIGKKYGPYIVIDVSKQRARSGSKLLFCYCSICKRTVLKIGTNLDHITSCSCTRFNRNKKFKHNFTKTRFYDRWRGLLFQKKKPDVDKKWTEFNNFYLDMYHSYLELKEKCKHEVISLKRIDKTKPWSKDNCYWKNRKIQSNKILHSYVLIAKDNDNDDNILCVEDIFKFCKIKNINLTNIEKEYKIIKVEKV